MKKYIQSLIILSFILASCSEDLEVKKAKISNILTGGNTKTWKLDSITFRYNNPEFGVEENQTAVFLEDYEADNLLTFKNEGLEFEELEGATKESESDENVTSSGTFILNIPSTSLDYSVAQRNYSVYYRLFNQLSSSADLELLQEDRIVYSFNGAPFAGFFGGTGLVVYYLSPVDGE